jgi:glycerol kinase
VVTVAAPGVKSPVVLAIDQGSSSTRCLAYDAQLRPVAGAARPVATSRPGPGMVEHDPAELFAGVGAALTEVQQELGRPVAGIGIANQTETFVLWDAESGEAVTPLVSWQDQRAAELCARLSRTPAAARVAAVTGLGLDPTFSAPKLAWIFERDPALHERAATGELCFGDVACWLAWKLSAAAGHVSEPSNACRSLLLDLDTLDWDDGLLDLFGVPRPLLPELRPSDDSGLHTAGTVVGFQAPVAAMLGDQPAALFGQGCTHPRMAALTLGTGAFLWLNAGAGRPQPPEGVLATAAWDSRRAGRAYALEAFCANAGNALAVLPRIGLGEAAAGAAPDWTRPRPVVVPAPAGLGTPHWHPADRITVLGASSTTTPADLAAAGLAGIAHQIADALEALDAAQSTDTLRVGGGLARNRELLQTVADLSGISLEVAADLEATARGIAAMATVAAGGELTEAEHAVAETVSPALADEQRRAERERWRQGLAVHMADAPA